jgi:hypothetical protein
MFDNLFQPKPNKSGKVFQVNKENLEAIQSFLGDRLKKIGDSFIEVSINGSNEAVFRVDFGNYIFRDAKGFLCLCLAVSSSELLH